MFYCYRYGEQRWIYIYGQWVTKMMFKMSTASLHTSWQTTMPLTNRCCDDSVSQVRPFNTALPSKQEKYLITHLHAWSISMEHAKNYEIGCKIIWNIWTKRVVPFFGQCNLLFLSTKVLQGSNIDVCKLYKGYNTVWSELCECIRANSLQTVL